MNKLQREWFREQFKKRGDMARKVSPLARQYQRIYQEWREDNYYYYRPEDETTKIKAEIQEAFINYRSVNNNPVTTTALLNIYHLLRGKELCVYHKYKAKGMCYSYNKQLKIWLDSGLIEGFTQDMYDRLSSHCFV